MTGWLGPIRPSVRDWSVTWGPDHHTSTMTAVEGLLGNTSMPDEFLMPVGLDSIQKASEERLKRRLVSYYMMGIGGTTLCCLGLVGNTLSMVVLCHREMRSSTYSYLSALSVCDSLVLLFTLILLVNDLEMPRLDQHWPWSNGLYNQLFPYIHPAAFTFQVASIWLTLAFTVDRYLMICHPLRARPYCTISRARKVVLALILTAIVLNVPKFLEYKTQLIVLPPNNATHATTDLTSFGRSKMFRALYHSWVYTACVCVVPFLALAVLNAFLARAVHISRRKGKELNVVERKKNSTTLMLMSVVAVFFLCQMPALVSRTIWAFDSNPGVLFDQMPFYILNETSNLLVILNSAFNIIPYYVFGHRFRNLFRRTFCPLLANNRFDDGDVATQSLSLLRK